MTITIGPYDTGPGANVTEDFWRKMADLWAPTGVIAGVLNECEVYADSTGMQCKVKSGRAWIRGHLVNSDAEEPKAIADNSSGQPRIDRVVWSNDFVANTISLVVLQGTPGATPNPPALTQTEDVLWQIPLAQIAVADSAVSIAAGNVTDERHMMWPNLATVVMVKGANQSRTSNTTLIDDVDLHFYAQDGETWIVDGTLYYTAATGGDLKLSLRTPAGSTGYWAKTSVQTGGGTAAVAQDLATGMTAGGEGAGNIDAFFLRAVVTAGADGDITLRFAQNSSNATATTLHAGSNLTARKAS